MQAFLHLPFLTQIGTIYIIIINIITFFFFGLDKLRSQVQGKSRVSEKTLWLLTAIGGFLGALSGMYFFRHKTKKLSFQVSVAVIIAIQAVLFYFLAT